MSEKTDQFALGSLVAAADAATGLDLGPSHPANAGRVELSIRSMGGVISRVDARPGALHRGVETLFEVRDFRQILSLANRHDWQAPIFGELLVAALVEGELGIEIPPRARWLRTLLAEHFRILSHLGYLSFVGWRLDRPDLATDALREELRLRTLELTGNRVHPMAVRLGGVAVDPDAAWLAREGDTVAAASELAERLGRALNDEGLGAGVARVSPEVVRAHGLSGPIARASGVPDDLRRDRPTLAYGALQDALIAPDAPADGDARSRFAWLAGEVRQSVDLVRRCSDALPGGELAVKLPKVVKLPEGDAYAEIEAPLGRAGVFVTSRGDKTPWRMRLRTPSFANVSSWSDALPGARLADLDTAVASLPYVTGDLDK